MFYSWSESSHKTDPLRSKGVKEGPLRTAEAQRREDTHRLLSVRCKALPSPQPPPAAPLQPTSPTLRKTIRDDGEGRGHISRQRHTNRVKKSPWGEETMKAERGRALLDPGLPRHSHTKCALAALHRRHKPTQSGGTVSPPNIPNPWYP